MTTRELSPRRRAAPGPAVAKSVRSAAQAPRRRPDLLPYIMVAPALLVIGAFSLLPTLYGVLVSVYRVEFVQLLTFVGVRNYVDVLTDPAFWNSVRVSVTFTSCSVALTFVAGFGLALLGNQQLRFRSAFRTITLLPWVTSYVVTYLIFRWILNADFGLLNAALVQGFGLPRVNWLGQPALALAALVVVDVWRAAPYAMVLLLAGLQGIPHELYEAAAIDGATRVRSFFGVTLPLMRPTILLLLVLLTIIDFNVVVAMLVLTGGGPGNATEAMSLRMYNEAFTYARMGPASAIAMIIFAANLVLTGVYIRLLRSEHYS
ncbi:MAG: sugar ABC transporter permease [Chloroflexi bacterium]|nr:sugar ABC transporter permease [Chloroflexota bacterium]